MEGLVIDSRTVLCGLALALSMFIGAACGGGAGYPGGLPAAPSNAPATAPPAYPGYPSATTPGYPGAPPAAPSAAYPEPEAPPQAAAGVSGAAPPAREAQRAAARSELDRAEGSLAASASDCSAACRALASMGRAVEHLCALVDSRDDQRRCDDARQRLSSAREHVRQTCGECSP
jgi:hypothetical protein